MFVIMQNCPFIENTRLIGDLAKIEEVHVHVIITLFLFPVCCFPFNTDSGMFFPNLQLEDKIKKELSTLKEEIERMREVQCTDIFPLPLTMHASCLLRNLKYMLT